MKAVASDWKREPFLDGEKIPLDLDVKEEEFASVENGVVPKEMEDKWFIYYEEPFLFLHRSWTGQPVYKVEFEKTGETYQVKEALLSSELLEGADFNYQGKLLRFILGNIVLNRNYDFPMPKGLKEKMPGVYQHHMSGTGYRESSDNQKRPWWKFW